MAGMDSARPTDAPKPPPPPPVPPDKQGQPSWGDQQRASRNTAIAETKQPSKSADAGQQPGKSADTGKPTSGDTNAGQPKSWGDRQDANRKTAIGDAKADQPRQSPADRQEIKSVAQKLLDAREAGLVKFGDDVQNPKTHTRTDGGTARYLQSITSAPDGRDLPMRPELAKVFDRVLTAAEHRREQGATGADFTIVSLDRQDKGHKDGVAVDLGRYAGHQIDFKNPDDSVKGIAQFYKDLLGNGDGGTTPVDAQIAIGVPRNPRTDAVGALAEYQDRGHPEKQKYYDVVPTQRGVNDIVSQNPFTVSTFRAELKERYVFPDVFFRRDQPPNISPTGRLMSDVAALQPEARRAFEPLAQQDRGAVLRYLFPDALDHFHVQALRPK